MLIGVPAETRAGETRVAATPETVKKLTSTVKNVDTVITGHSTVMKWQDLVEYGEFLQAFLDAARTSMKAGKTPEQAAAEIKLPRFSGYTIPTSGFAAAPAAIKTAAGTGGARRRGCASRLRVEADAAPGNRGAHCAPSAQRELVLFEPHRG